MHEGNANAVGCDGTMEKYMNAKTNSAAKSASGLMSIVFVALTGATLVFLSGLANASTLHDAAHDVRHTTGFPCH